MDPTWKSLELLVRLAQAAEFFKFELKLQTSRNEGEWREKDDPYAICEQ